MSHYSILAQAPGRVNIIGEHTDYNQGFVLPAAIDKKTCFELRKNTSSQTVNIIAESINERLTLDLSRLTAGPEGWQNYIIGVIAELQKLGADISGFDAKFYGDIPIGAGVSSSAALECSLACGLNKLFDLGLNNWQIIKACQMAEHNYAGIKCGIMDQFASVMGKKDHVMLLDCKSLEFEYFPCILGAYEFILINSNVTHTLSSSEYNIRREECLQAIECLKTDYPRIESLRDVTTQMLASSAGLLSEILYRRAQHVISENKRTQEATEALLDQDYKKLGRLLYQSHSSLQNDYEVSCPEIDYLIELARNKEYVLGSRMMGAGFGGCTLSLLKKDANHDFIDYVNKEYSSKFSLEISPISVRLDDGARVTVMRKT